MGETAVIVIWFVVMFPCLILVAALLTNEAKPKKNIILGVTLPLLAQSDPRVGDIVRRFKRNVWLCTGAMALIFAALAFLGTGQFMMWSLALLIVAVFTPYAFYARANRKLAALKKAEGWHVPYSGGVVVDLRAAAAPMKALRRRAFLPPMLIAAVPLILALLSDDEGVRWGGVIMFGVTAFVGLVCMLMYPLILRQRGDVASPDSDVNAALTRVRRYNYGKMLLATSYLTAVFMLAYWLLQESALWTLVLTVVYMFVLTGFCLATEFSVRRTQERLTAGESGYVDEDDLWLWGMFYNNPNDRHLFINDRTGSGMGVNVGRPAGRVFMALTAALILGLAVVSIALALGFSAPFEAHIESGTLYFEHGMEKYEIPLEDITSLELIDDLPSARRIAGTGLPNLVEGRFRVEGYENTRISLNPGQPPYIAVLTPEFSRIFALGTPQETEAFYNELEEALS